MNGTKRVIQGIIFCTAAAAVGLYAADGNESRPYPDPVRWSQDAEMFAQWDRKNSFPADAVVFVGSSSIRYWPTAEAFGDLPVINRGFGGSFMADSVYYADAFVLKYRPKVVVVYAGDNDCTGGILPRSIADDFVKLAERIHTALPNTEIICLSVKRSQSRRNVWPQMAQVNQYYKEYASRKDYITYVDVDAVLQKEKDTPDPAFYLSDQLHLNEQGYAVWNRWLSPILKERYALAMSKEKKAGKQ